MIELQTYNPALPINGLCWYGADIKFNNSNMMYYVSDGVHPMTKKQIVQFMYEITIEYNDGDVEMYDILPEKYSNIIKWLVDYMPVNTEYKVTSEQKKLILHIWDILVLDEKHTFKFNSDYTKLIKNPIQ